MCNLASILLPLLLFDVYAKVVIRVILSQHRHNKLVLFRHSGCTGRHTDISISDDFGIVFSILYDLRDGGDNMMEFTRAYLRNVSQCGHGMP